ncbi:MAG: ATP-grasp domain-containing protein [Lachnospiraceae bacterium]|nr:ATP-grasp domain-containing protein [Lachnospiraceae bacterium]
MKKLAIIGASYLQEPLIQKAKQKGIETHVFAWAAGDVGEKSADFFYPISIVEKDEILAKCREIGIDGICTIASDLAVITVNYVANALGLIANSMEATIKSTNKHEMRKCFEEHGDPSPKSFLVETAADLEGKDISYPVIVKPLDRSGSRGITKLESPEGLAEAIENAKAEGFDKHALVEEFAEGDEYSVEYISWRGKHTFLALTKKYTTGAPHFIETGHVQPADVTEAVLAQVKAYASHALDSLGIEFGASHIELKIDKDGNIKLIEIGGRMGGDLIGSALVELSTGFDFVGAVIDIALGKAPEIVHTIGSYCAVRFIFNKEDVETYEAFAKKHPKALVEADIREVTEGEVTDSGKRFGYYLIATKNQDEFINCLTEILNKV